MDHESALGSKIRLTPALSADRDRFGRARSESVRGEKGGVFSSDFVAALRDPLRSGPCTDRIRM